MTEENRTLSPATRLAQALRFVDAQTGAIIPAIHPAATYARDENHALRGGLIYRRDGNQTTAQAEAILADLEGAAETMLFSTGISAATAVIEQLPADAHVVVPDVMYYGVLGQFHSYAEKRRLRVSHYAAGNLDEMRARMRAGDTALLWVETPNNPNWDVTDIEAAAEIAHAAGARLVTDCTATPPCVTRALVLGADISFHSATKYLNGHSDITAGVLSVREKGPFWEEIAEIRNHQGTVLNTWDAWLLIRGMRTLILRYERATENALQLAAHLEQHPGVEAVLYPVCLRIPATPSRSARRAVCSAG